MKIFVIAASLFLFATPAISSTSAPQMEMPFLFSFATPTISATAYPPEIKKRITQESKSFVCKTTSSLFIKVYADPKSIIYIAGHAEKEMMITETNEWNDASNFLTDKPVRVFLRTSSGWKKSDDLTKQEDGEVENMLQPFHNDEALATLQSCVKSNLRAPKAAAP
ncbi:hypothetical protein KGQ34_04495 [Patescibacteria group bacterium]|nr:hypothetical protein [Patescibacteria group bacterium]